MKHLFNFDPDGPGGESLILVTNLVPNGDTGVVGYEQKLTLASYGNSASFNLSGSPFTPNNLRQLADELDVLSLQAKELCK